MFKWITASVKNAVLAGVQEAVNELQLAVPTSPVEPVILQLDHRELVTDAEVISKKAKRA